MTTMNISLPDDLKAAIDEQVASGGYGTSSEYVRDAIRKDLDRRRLRALIIEGLESEEGEPVGEEHIEELRDYARQRAVRSN